MSEIFIEATINMWCSTGIKLLLFAISSRTLLVAADPLTIITVTSVNVENNPNDYFDPWDVQVLKTKKSSHLTIKMPTKKTLPDTMMFKITLLLSGQDEPIEYETTVCDALSDKVIGQSFVNAGTPKATFPRKCPFTPGDWVIMDWNPPAEMVPPGIPDGPITGYAQLYEEGKPPCVKMVYEAMMSHSLPGLIG